LNDLVFFDLELLIMLISAGDKEKKAASAPEINADRTSNTKTAKRAAKRLRVNGFTVTVKTVLIVWR
jgi:hypothetical protein